MICVLRCCRLGSGRPSGLLDGHFFPYPSCFGNRGRRDSKQLFVLPWEPRMIHLRGTAGQRRRNVGRIPNSASLHKTREERGNGLSGNDVACKGAWLFGHNTCPMISAPGLTGRHCFWSMQNWKGAFHFNPIDKKSNQGRSSFWIKVRQC